MTTIEWAKEWAEDHEEEILLADGFEDAFVGVAQIFNEFVAVYDMAKCLGILMTRDGMTYEEADEYFTFNVTGAYVGKRTPAFLIRPPEDADAAG